MSLAKQGQWMQLEGVERRKISSREPWGMEKSSFSFIIIATYDLLQSLKNFHQWYSNDRTRALSSTAAPIKHMVGCKISFTQGRYRDTYPWPTTGRCWQTSSSTWDHLHHLHQPQAWRGALVPLTEDCFRHRADSLMGRRPMGLRTYALQN